MMGLYSNSGISTVRRDAPGPQLALAVRGLGERIATARQARGWTQAELAVQAGLGLSTVRRVESGFDGVALGHLAKILTAFDMLSQLEALVDTKTDPEMVNYASDAMQSLGRRGRHLARR